MTSACRTLVAVAVSIVGAVASTASADGRARAEASVQTPAPAWWTAVTTSGVALDDAERGKWGAYYHTGPNCGWFTSYGTGLISCLREVAGTGTQPASVSLCEANLSDEDGNWYCQVFWGRTSDSAPYESGQPLEPYCARSKDFFANWFDEWRFYPRAGDGSGVADERCPFGVVDNPPAEPPPPKPPVTPQPREDVENGPTKLDQLCNVGAPTAGFATGWAGILRDVSDIPANALGGIGTVVGLAGAACTATSLPGVETNTATAATAACVGLTTFSTGVGIGSLGLAGTVVGLPGAAVGGFVSVVTGAVASIPCSYSPNLASMATASVVPSRSAQSADYRTVATATPMRVRVPKWPARVDRRTRKALRKLAGNTGVMLGAADALGLCLARAQAAQAARDMAWHDRQGACAAANATRIASRLRHQAELQKRIAASFRASGARDVRVSKTKTGKALRNLPPAVIDQLTAAGAGPAQVAAYKTRAAELASRVPASRKVTELIGGKATQNMLKRSARFFARLAENVQPTG